MGGGRHLTRHSPSATPCQLAEKRSELAVLEGEPTSPYPDYAAVVGGARSGIPVPPMSSLDAASPPFPEPPVMAGAVPAEVTSVPSEIPVGEPVVEPPVAGFAPSSADPLMREAV